VAHDSCGHAAPGQAITFREYDDGLLLGANPVVTNRHGRAAIRVRTGSTIGEHVIAAYLSPSDSLRFHFTVISPAVLIRSASAMIPSESRPLQELAVAVKVVDRDGTVRPGVKVDFSVQQGDGVLREPGFAISDAQGNVIAHWQLGRLGRQSLTAWIDGYIEETEVWETMVANSAPRFQMPDTLRFRVGDINQRSIQATDSDGDSVSILCSPLPKGAAYDSLNKTVLWQPFPRDLGLYPVWWYAADNFGSRDSLKMFFHVYKQNRPPALLSRHPADSMLFIPYQRLMNFSIDVKDDDLDSLAFQWSVNGQALQQNREQSVFFSPTFPKETVLRIEVSDGEALLAIRWQIKLSATGLEKSDLAVIPSSWNLYQNYPNPFNSRTRIMFDVPEPDFVSVKIFSLTGDEIITLVNSRVVAGRYGVSWDACNSAGGVYLCVLRSSTVRCFHKLILLR
jgi:hypothetical protein